MFKFIILALYKTSLAWLCLWLEGCEKLSLFSNICVNLLSLVILTKTCYVSYRLMHAMSLSITNVGVAKLLVRTLYSLNGHCLRDKCWGS